MALCMWTMISSAQGCMSSTALAPLKKHHARRQPEAAVVRAHPEGSRGVAQGPVELLRGTREMAELQHITLSRTEAPIYIRIDIIK